MQYVSSNDRVERTSLDILVRRRCLLMSRTRFELKKSTVVAESLLCSKGKSPPRNQWRRGGEYPSRKRLAHLLSVSQSSQRHSRASSSARSWAAYVQPRRRSPLIRNGTQRNWSTRARFLPGGLRCFLSSVQYVHAPVHNSPYQLTCTVEPCFHDERPQGKVIRAQGVLNDPAPRGPQPEARGSPLPVIPLPSKTRSGRGVCAG